MARSGSGTAVGAGWLQNALIVSENTTAPTRRTINFNMATIRHGAGVRLKIGDDIVRVLATSASGSLSAASSPGMLASLLDCGASYLPIQILELRQMWNLVAPHWSMSWMPVPKAIVNRP